MTVLAFGGPTHADTIEITADMLNATEGDANFSGSITWDAAPSGMSGILTIMLTNLTDISLGGFITGFVLNNPSADAGSTVSLQSASHPLQFVQNASGSPFGTFDFGAALGGNFLGGGNPNSGIAVGDTGIFEFLINANDAGSLMAADFLGSGDNPGFIVRFRGLDSEAGSDKVPAVIVPLPAPVALGLVGLAGLVVARNRRMI